MDKKDTYMKLLYSLIIFLGAFLMFMVQPVVGKILTPQYGGGADIWTGCLVFFQFMLFLGYLLALFLNKLKPKVNAICYGILFILAFLLFKMPTEFGSWLADGVKNPVVSLFLSLFKYAALPILVLSTISVSMQNWYTKQTGKQPYILYSISNIGSFLALFFYPLVYEPLMGTSSIVGLWKGAFGFLTLLVIAAVFVYFSKSDNKNENNAAEDNKNIKISVKDYIYWILLSMAGVILLTSYTTFATVKILPMPMLWTLFLAIYLLTFVLCFGFENFYKRNTVVYIISIFSFISLLTSPGTKVMISLPPFLVLFFAFLVFLNGEIYKTRPHASKLSEFYLSIAFGGALGGFFVNIIAPCIFNSYVELPFINVIVYVFAGYLAIKEILSVEKKTPVVWVKTGVLLFLAILTVYYGFNLCFKKSDNVIIKTYRNFYGTVRVTTHKDKNVRFISHGNTVHGIQVYDYKTNKFENEPLSYYSRMSGFSYVFEGMKNHQGTKKRALNIGVIGLGAGTTASYTEKNDTIDFYEIDPKIYDIAKRDFGYLNNAKGKVNVYLGDARIVLDKTSAQKYDILLVDAFSSDAIPVHLITKEAFDIYREHTKEDGIILFHISNRYLILDAMLKKIADANDLRNIYFNTYYIYKKDAKKQDNHNLACEYFIVFMPKNNLYNNFKDFSYGALYPNFAAQARAREPLNDKFLKPFTDDYSSLVRVLRFWTAK